MTEGMKEKGICVGESVGHVIISFSHCIAIFILQEKLRYTEAH